jgi:hypothetical protein
VLHGETDTVPTPTSVCKPLGLEEAREADQSFVRFVITRADMNIWHKVANVRHACIEERPSEFETARKATSLSESPKTVTEVLMKRVRGSPDILN